MSNVDCLASLETLLDKQKVTKIWLQMSNQSETQQSGRGHLDSDSMITSHDSGSMRAVVMRSAVNIVVVSPC